jgi:predicted DNA-binding protein (MmcQ/YjbR family)
MNPEWVRNLCLSFRGATEHVIWGNDLTFKVAGKIFAHTVLDPAAVWLSFKASSENFYQLTERPNIVPAPYLARAQWVALQSRDALTAEELAALLRESYDLVVAKLPKKTREALSAQTPPARRTRRKRPSAKPSRNHVGATGKVPGKKLLSKSSTPKKTKATKRAAKKKKKPS